MRKRLRTRAECGLLPERRVLDRIKKVVARIEDSGTGDAERETAYRALSGLVGELEHVEVAPSAVRLIEERAVVADRLIGARRAEASGPWTRPDTMAA